MFKVNQVMRIALVFSVLVTVLITSCTIPTELAVYNNSSAAIEFTFNGLAERVESGAAFSIKDQFFLPDVTIMMNGVSLIYRPEWPTIPENFVSWRGWGLWAKRLARLQVERDGKIWLIGLEQEAPVSEFVPQPEGFPLEPDGV